MYIDSYSFTGPLGRGSFGEVWKVEPCKKVPAIGVRLAAKISYLPADCDEVTEEMRHTIEIITSNHQNVLRLFVAEEFIGGRLLLLMELADCSLLDRLRECELCGMTFPLEELIQYAGEAAQALDYLHGHGLIHGGINPGDILLLNRHVRIADPGPSISPNHSLKNALSSNLAKAICMAPERKVGNEHYQSDQFALAASYLWMRAGRPVVGLDSQLDATSSINCLSVPEQDVLFKALSPNPANRFSSCIEFAKSLEKATVNRLSE